MKNLGIGRGVLGLVLGLSFISSQAFADDTQLKYLLQNGLLGAGVGAISAEASGGKAGKGALIGAGTNIIGTALFGFLTQPSSASQPVYAQPQSYYAAQPVYQQPVYQQPVYQPVVQQVVQPDPVYYVQSAPPSYTSYQEDPTKKILKQGLLGAGVGAISADVSGGKAGTGALVGAGTNVIGSALFDFLLTPSAQSQPSYYYTTPSNPSQPGKTLRKKHVIRKFDAYGKVISEEEYWE